MSCLLRRRTVVGLWAALVMVRGSVQGSVPEADATLEFRFAGPASGPWRAVRPGLARHAPSAEPWVAATSATGTRRVWLGDRVTLRLQRGAAFPEAALRRLGLRADRRIDERLWILQARDGWAAANGAAALAGEPGVDVAVPVMRRSLALHGPFGPRPNDPYFTNQWHLENREAAGGAMLGPDTNPRAAWTSTRGEGVIIAIGDDGFETEHPDLRTATLGAPHYDFTRSRTNPATYGSHSTPVAGLAGATGGNGVGVTGLAPAARLASWAIFDGSGNIVNDESLMEMFKYRFDEVQVQNHSWGNADTSLSQPSVLEASAIDQALVEGRQGRGVVMVRSGGNGREGGGNVNDDGYANDPRVIAVAAVRKDGRVASYSNPGACLLVSAPSGDDSDTFNPTINICTTDRVGTQGYNQVTFTNDLADYAFLAFGFSGTSASAPQIAGLCGLILSANPGLGFRDVQQVLMHAARQYDLADPTVQTNAAGYVVSHNQGFGVPDAGQAVDLARSWSNRPALTTVAMTNLTTVEVPDDGLRVWVDDGIGGERSLRCQPALGAHADEATARLPLVFVGLATNTLGVDLRGKAALIERGTNYFRDKIAYAAAAGASFAVIYNHLDGDQIIIPGGTDFSPIPAVMISEDDGRGLVAELESGLRREAQLRLATARHEFVVTNTLLCEHVALRVRADHERRGDLRITLVSPGGTRSVLQQLNRDSEPGPDDWTYGSVQHYGETSAGRWTAYFSDEDLTAVGSILGTQLILRGVAIEDSDADGLDDRWEQRWFGDLRAEPRQDPDGDGSPNAREQTLGTDPTRAEPDFQLAVAPYDERLLRLSWPATAASQYEVLEGDTATGAVNPAGLVPGRFPEAEWLVPVDRGVNRFFRIETGPRPTPGVR